MNKLIAPVFFLASAGVFSLAFAVITLISASTASAQKGSPGISYSMPAAEVGFKWNTATITNSVSDKQEVGFQLGVSAVFNLSENFGLKSGMFYTERPFKSEISLNNSPKGKLTYFEVPVLFMFKFEDFAGAYVGPSLAVKLGDEITPGSLKDIKSFVVPITFGAQFKFTPVLGANVFFEIVPGDLATDLSNSRAVGVNLLLALD